VSISIKDSNLASQATSYGATSYKLEILRRQKHRHCRGNSTTIMKCLVNACSSEIEHGIGLGSKFKKFKCINSTCEFNMDWNQYQSLSTWSQKISQDKKKSITNDLTRWSYDDPVNLLFVHNSTCIAQQFRAISKPCSVNQLAHWTVMWFVFTMRVDMPDY